MQQAFAIVLDVRTIDDAAGEGVGEGRTLQEGDETTRGLLVQEGELFLCLMDFQWSP